MSYCTQLHERHTVSEKSHRLCSNSLGRYGYPQLIRVESDLLVCSATQGDDPLRSFQIEGIPVICVSSMYPVTPTRGAKRHDWPVQG